MKGDGETPSPQPPALYYRVRTYLPDQRNEAVRVGVLVARFMAFARRLIPFGACESGRGVGAQVGRRSMAALG